MARVRFQERFACAFTRQQLVISATRALRHHDKSEKLKLLTSFWGVLCCLCEKRLQHNTVSEQKRTEGDINPLNPSDYYMYHPL
jgi:hypothetical protein